MKVLIDIPQETFKATQTYYSDFTTRLSMKKCTEIIANGTPIPDNATNGDVVKAMFPNELLTSITSTLWWGDNMSFNKDWWNAPYKGVEE